MREPRLTIGMPVRNGAATLRRTLASIEAQTFRDFCVVIADNASTDATAAMVADFAKGKDYVRIITRPEEIPWLANFSGLALSAETELFVWLADDDWWEPDFLRECVQALDRNPAACSAFTHFRVYYHFKDTFGDIVQYVPSLSRDNFVNVIIRSCDMAPCALYGATRTRDLKDALRREIQFDFWGVFTTMVLATRGMMEIVPRDLYRSGVRSEGAILRRSLDGSALKYRPFLVKGTRLIYRRLPAIRATLATLIFWLQLWETYRYHKARPKLFLTGPKATE